MRFFNRILKRLERSLQSKYLKRRHFEDGKRVKAPVCSRFLTNLLKSLVRILQIRKIPIESGTDFRLFTPQKQGFCLAPPAGPSRGKAKSPVFGRRARGPGSDFQGWRQKGHLWPIGRIRV